MQSTRRNEITKQVDDTPHPLAHNARVQTRVPVRRQTSGVNVDVVLCEPVGAESERRSVQCAAQTTACLGQTGMILSQVVRASVLAECIERSITWPCQLPCPHISATKRAHVCSSGGEHGASPRTHAIRCHRSTMPAELPQCSCCCCMCTHAPASGECSHAHEGAGAQVQHCIEQGQLHTR